MISIGKLHVTSTTHPSSMPILIPVASVHWEVAQRYLVLKVAIPPVGREPPRVLVRPEDGGSDGDADELTRGDLDAGVPHDRDVHVVEDGHRESLAARLCGAVVERFGVQVDHVAVVRAVRHRRIDVSRVISKRVRARTTRLRELVGRTWAAVTQDHATYHKQFK